MNSPQIVTEACTAEGPAWNGTTVSLQNFSTPAQRRTALIALLAKQYREFFDADGGWISELPPPDTREMIWGVFCLLQSNKEDRELANNVLRRLEFCHHEAARSAQEKKSFFDIFVTNHTIQMLVQYGDVLEPDVRQKLEGWARNALNDYPGDRQCDYQFHGMNDNMPSKATLGMILGGEYFGDDEAVQHGLWNLRQLRDLLTRRGLFSEYTSPTYLPLTIINLTEIVLHARNAEAKKLASQCVERAWADVIGHFHPGTGTMGGPYSRAYQIDSTAQFSTMNCLLWIVLGNKTAVDIYAELARPEIRLVHHHDNRVTQMGVASWITSSPAVPPRYLLEWLERREYPFHLEASAERGFAQAGEVNTSFYAEENFALGTAANDGWSEQQAEMFFLQFRRHAPLRGVEDLRTVYCRYLANDQHPGDTKADHCLQSHGIVHTVHQGRTAMVLARPSLSLEENEIHTLKFAVILPQHFNKVEKIEVHNRCVFIHDGPVYIGLRGLNVTDWGCENAIGIETNNHYRVISFYNYKGVARRFNAEELGRTLNGFVAVVGLQSEESWQAFCKRVEEAEVLDYFHFGSRTVRCKIGETLLGMSYEVKGDRVRYRTIGGLPASQPAWKADGMPLEQLPLLGTPQPNTLELPFKHLRVVWGPEEDNKWVIASTGKPRSGISKPSV